MGKLTRILVGVTIAIIIIGVGSKYMLDSIRPVINSNEKIVSATIDKNGEPKDILGDVKDIEVLRDKGEVYVSVKVNNKRMKKSRVTVDFEQKKIDDTKISVSDAGYVSYHFTKLESMEPGLYQIGFYDDKGEINVYAALILK